MPTVPATASTVTTALGLAGLLSAALPAAQIPPLREPAVRAAIESLGAGKVLVAARRLPDPNFANTVVLLVDVNADGAVGLVLNRRSGVPLTKVFPQLMPNVAMASHAFLGGPVEPTRPLVLMRGGQRSAGARDVVDGVRVATAREAVEAAIAASSTSTLLRVYLGYAGWGAGQLQAETALGAWHVLEGDAAVVFDDDPASTWQRQIARTELIQARADPPRPGLVRRIDRW